MKIIHCADVHLGSKMDSRFPKEISDTRKVEVRDTFRRIVSYAKENGIRVILLSGDVFDSDSPFKKDRDFFYGAVRDNPEIDFLYLRGNHDKEGLTEPFDNLKTFSDEWRGYVYENVTVSGIETVPGNASSLYSTYSPNRETRNIVMLHGQIGTTPGIDRVDLSALANRGIDYLALGHIHKTEIGNLDENAYYAYPGTPEGRGFDEPGEHGFFVIDTDGEKITPAFVPIAKRKITIVDVDVSGVTDAYQAVERVRNSVVFDRENIYRIVLTGEIAPESDVFSDDVCRSLEGSCLYLDVKDKTVRRPDPARYENDPSLIGEFVRTVMNDASYTDEDKALLLAFGTRALGGREIDT